VRPASWARRRSTTAATARCGSAGPKGRCSPSSSSPKGSTGTGSPRSASWDGRTPTARPSIPRATTVAFVSGVSGLASIYVVPFDGSTDPVQLTNVGHGAGAPVARKPADGWVAPPIDDSLQFDGDWLTWNGPHGAARRPVAVVMARSLIAAARHAPDLLVPELDRGRARVLPDLLRRPLRRRLGLPGPHLAGAHRVGLRGRRIPGHGRRPHDHGALRARSWPRTTARSTAARRARVRGAPATATTSRSSTTTAAPRCTRIWRSSASRSRSETR
jgi:hypothetical protein